MSPNNEYQSIPICSPNELTPLNQQHARNDTLNSFHEFINIHDDESNDELHRHLTLFDLVCVGVGATVGSGIYVVTGLIAHSLAGPSTFISWTLAGCAACLSGLCYAEQGGRFPSAGSTYVYAKETLGELVSVIAGACLTLEYVGSASAVARSWGDKVVEYVRSQQSSSDSDGLGYLLWILDPGMGINPCAFLVSAAAVLLLLNGVKESKFITNLFTTLNVTLLLFMAGTALILAKAENLTPLIPPQFGASGIIRGATSSFFGYIGFDEICCIAGEAVDPARNMPRAIILTLVIVTSLYITASLGLTGMVPYEDISETSGFPNGFRYRGLDWAAQIAAVSIQLFQLFSPTYELHVFARLIFRFLHPTRLVNWWLYLLLYWLQSWRNLVFSMQWPKIIYYLQYLPKQMKWATLSMA
jgi:amino acid transporter